MKTRMNVVDFASDILDMQETIYRLQDEVKHLRHFKDAYYELLNSSLDHNQKMMRNVLDMALTPGVVQAMLDHNAN